MARPQKRGIDYFPFDVEFFDDKKIKVLKGRYGADGIAVYIYLLTLIYRENGYYAEYDEDLKYIISGDLNMKDEKIEQIINFLLERSLFNDKLFKSDKVLTSRGIQLRFQEATKSRGSKTAIEIEEKFWVLSSEETQSHIKCTLFENCSEKNPSFSENNSDNSEKNSIKKSKEKKSKINKSKVNDDGLSSVVVCYENNVAPINQIVRDSMIDWLNDVDSDVIIWAINEAVKLNKRNWKYIEGILRNQFNKGNTTMAKITASEKERGNNIKSNSYTSNNNAYDFDGIEKQMWANLKNENTKHDDYSDLFKKFELG